MAENGRVRWFRFSLAIAGFFVFTVAVVVDASKLGEASPSAVSIFGLLFIGWLLISMLVKMAMVIGDSAPLINVVSLSLWIMAVYTGGMSLNIPYLIGFFGWAAIDLADLVIVELVKIRGAYR